MAARRRGRCRPTCCRSSSRPSDRPKATASSGSARRQGGPRRHRPSRPHRKSRARPGRTGRPPGRPQEPDQDPSRQPKTPPGPSWPRPTPPSSSTSPSATNADKRYTANQRGSPGPHTTFRQNLQTRPRLTWKLRAHAVRRACRLRWLLAADHQRRRPHPAEILAAYRYQPHLERRHHCLKGAQAVAPVRLHSPARIEALLCCHFLALLVHALIERQIRAAMTTAGSATIGLYPEQRDCPAPSAARILDIFAGPDPPPPPPKRPARPSLRLPTRHPTTHRAVPPRPPPQRLPQPEPMTITPIAIPTAWNVLHQALAAGRALRAGYHDRLRIICPHALAWKNGRPKVLVYQTDILGPTPTTPAAGDHSSSTKSNTWPSATTHGPPAPTTPPTPPESTPSPSPSPDKAGPIASLRRRAGWRRPGFRGALWWCRGRIGVAGGPWRRSLGPARLCARPGAIRTSFGQGRSG